MTNCRSSKGCGCHFWNIQRAEHAFLCFTTFSLALFTMPICATCIEMLTFFYFSTIPFFIPCIAKSSTDSVTHWCNPLIYELIIAIHLLLIYALMIRGGGSAPLLLSMHKWILYVQIQLGKLHVYTASKMLFLRKDSSFNFH